MVAVGERVLVGKRETSKESSDGVAELVAHGLGSAPVRERTTCLAVALVNVDPVDDHNLLCAE